MKKLLLTTALAALTPATQGESIQNIINRDPVSFESAGYRLNLRKKDIETLDGLRDIPGVRNVKALDVSFNQLRGIERDTFADLRMLTELDLSSNKIRHLQPGAFNGLKSIRLINLIGNPISPDIKQRITGEIKAVAPHAEIRF